MAILNCFIFHNWGMLEEVAWGDLCKGEDKVGRYLEQKRVCKNCGKAQLRDART